MNFLKDKFSKLETLKNRLKRFQDAAENIEARKADGRVVKSFSMEAKVWDKSGSFHTSIGANDLFITDDEALEILNRRIECLSKEVANIQSVFDMAERVFKSEEVGCQP